MSRIAIPRIRDDRPAVEYRVKLDPSLNDELLLYRGLYVQTYGQEIEAKDLLEPILRRFLSTDRAFRQFRKTQSRQPASVSVSRPRRIDDSILKQQGALS